VRKTEGKALRLAIAAEEGEEEEEEEVEEGEVQ
jgi:hypothetical protein